MLKETNKVPKCFLESVFPLNVWLKMAPTLYGFRLRRGSLDFMA